ncbi:glycoside hydrolase family 28 protein [Pseudoduganella namucuonensis]|uniref:Polygalacturonase n=1 Tax=Pseudoduganella namucuonensis TaxID=1035707 RepID=A0A1I7EXP7_9BURK|nr:glycoside hydrolase family 28 protein [Pseudoduganella namucuonensis]SFU28665.1 Polygalacturonase [Pseudoduganella namucuonensis]
MSININQRRRNLMKAASAAGAALAGGVPAAAQAASEPDPWERAAEIVKRLSKPLNFRKEDFPVTKYGAAPCKLRKVKGWISFEDEKLLDTPVLGAKDCYSAFAAAIAACHKAGGGRVVIPAGDWYCAGPIVLLSNVHVHLKKGAHIYFSNNPGDYAKYGDFDCGKNGKLVITRWQSNDCLNFASMVYAYGQDNIAFTGEDWTSVINGQGGLPFEGGNDCWWTWKGKQRTMNSIAQGSTPNYVAGKPAGNAENALNPKSMIEVAPNLTEEERLLIQGEGGKWRADEHYLPALSEAGVPLARRVFGLGHYLRPSMVHIIGCTNVLLQGYQVTHTPFWQHHPVHCRNLVIRNVFCNSLGPNSDGFDPEACDHVLVEGCTFDSGDDCIAIKAGKNQDTHFGPSQNIVIQKCVMQSGHGAVTLGSEMAGGIQNVYAQDLVFENINWATNPLNTAIRLKTNLNRGGYLRNFYVRNVSIPNGVQTSPSFYASLPGSPIQSRTVATAAGAVVTFDCDYAPIADSVRTRPPIVTNVQISNVKVGNVKTKDGKPASCFQAIVILGPVASDYNGPQPMPVVVPVTDVTITDCDFGTPVNDKAPWWLYNVKGLKLKNVTIGGTVHNTTLSA